MRELTEEEKEALVGHFHRCFDRPTAYWIPYIGYYMTRWECSKCKNISDIPLKTCPNCEAEMKMQ